MVARGGGFACSWVHAVSAVAVVPVDFRAGEPLDLEGQAVVTTVSLVDIDVEVRDRVANEKSAYCVQGRWYECATPW